MGPGWEPFRGFRCYESVEELCHRHEGLVRWVSRRWADDRSALLNSWDLQQQLRLVLVDVWDRHAGTVRSEVDRIVRAALTHAARSLLQREARWRRGDEAAVRVVVCAPVDGFVRVFEREFERELRACLSDISAAVLWELTHPTPRLRMAMLAGRERGGLVPVARYFHLSPWVLRSVLSELRRAFSEAFEVPMSALALRHLYR